MRSAGRSPASGWISCRYWPIASVFQTVAPSCERRGTRIDGASRSNSLRTSASSGETVTSSNSRPAKRHISHPRSDHDE
jgi:hypothetical protein